MASVRFQLGCLLLIACCAIAWPCAAAPPAAKRDPAWVWKEAAERFREVVRQIEAKKPAQADALLSSATRELPTPYREMSKRSQTALREAYQVYVPGAPSDDPFGASGKYVLDFEQETTTPYLREAQFAKALTELHDYNAAIAHGRAALEAYRVEVGAIVGKEVSDENAEDDISCSISLWILRAGRDGEGYNEVEKLLGSDKGRALWKQRLKSTRWFFNVQPYGLAGAGDWQKAESASEDPVDKSRFQILMAARLGALGDEAGFLAWEARHQQNFGEQAGARATVYCAIDDSALFHEDTGLLLLVRRIHPAARELQWQLLESRFTLAKYENRHHVLASMYPEMLRLKPNDGPTLEAAGHAERKLGNHRAAIALYNRLLSLPVYDYQPTIEGDGNIGYYSHHEAAWGIVKSHKALGETKKAFAAAQTAHAQYRCPFGGCLFGIIGRNATEEFEIAQLALAAGEEEGAIGLLEELVTRDYLTGMRASSLLVQHYRRRGKLAELPARIEVLRDREYEQEVRALAESGIPPRPRRAELDSDLGRAKLLVELTLLADRGDAKAVWVKFKNICARIGADSPMYEDDSNLRPREAKRLIELTQELIVAHREIMEPVLLREIQGSGDAEGWAIYLLAQCESKHATALIRRWLLNFQEERITIRAPSSDDPFGAEPLFEDAERTAWRLAYERENVRAESRAATAADYALALSLLTTPAARRVHSELIALDRDVINSALNEVKWRSERHSYLENDDEEEE